jgi:hypothetical protein
MPSVVVSRATASNGLQIYGVRSFAEVDDNRERLMLGSALVSVSVGDEPCMTCLLYKTAGCPGA